jgi:hypothetical protein
MSKKSVLKFNFEGGKKRRTLQSKNSASCSGHFLPRACDQRSASSLFQKLSLNTSAILFRNTPQAIHRHELLFVPFGNLVAEWNTFQQDD